MLRRTFIKLRNNKISFYTNRSYSSRNIIKLKERDMFQDLFPDTSVKEVTDLLNVSPQTVYAGFDPTADSLHVGNLLILINLLHWQRGGHNIIAVLGGATAKIGDPSGRSTERNTMLSSVIDENILGIRKDIEKIFKNHEELLYNSEEGEKKSLKPPMILNNEDWYNKISPVKLIGEVGRFLRMGTLLSRTSVQNRLNSSAGMSFTEFSYQLFQAYDWLHLFKKYKCRFQIGGNDQMGNIMTGHELISKTHNVSVYGLTMPIITTEMGDKFGKSAGNAVWLSPKKTSPFTFYQFWMRLTDVDAQKMLKLFTFEPIGKIKDLVRQHKEKPETRLLQKKLAETLTLLVHGIEGLKSAQNASQALYEGSVAALGQMPAEELVQLFQGATIAEVLPEPGQSVMELAMKVGCFLSKHDATRIITAGGFYINQQRANNPSEVLNPTVHRLANNVTLLRVGKRNYYIVKWV